ncbi:hypothetical protein DZF91_37875 [Actinomadura logoneensis]|uniref:Uncharacterized protein n=1 Tax=Actinomadura logoneensis TaxID=2293572 RepID=A0A372J933_9ACTN|nr:hypothetical protein DZF91_37875 [Actinomadura logoneensis]
MPEVAGVLLNNREDEPTDVILATPPGPGLTTGLDPAEADSESYTYWVLSECVSAYRQQFPDASEEGWILIHMETSGLDMRDIDAPIRGLVRFFGEERR